MAFGPGPRWGIDVPDLEIGWKGDWYRGRPTIGFGKKKSTPKKSTFRSRVGGPDLPPERKSSAEIRAMQEFLKEQGYNLTVDGIEGPQTISALNNWRSGVKNRNPNAWNSKIVRMDDPNRHNKPTSPNNQRNQPAESKANKLKVQKTIRQSGTQRVTSREAVIDGALNNLPDDISEEELRNIVEKQYSGILSNIDARVGGIRAGLTQNLERAQQMFGALDSRMAERLSQAKIEGERTQAAIDSVAPELMDALGVAALDPSVAATVATNADISSDFYRAAEASDMDFGQDLRGIYQQAGAEAQIGLQRQAAEMIADLEAQRGEILGAKGGDLAELPLRLRDMQMQDREFDLRERGFEQDMRSSRLRDQMALAQHRLAVASSPLEKKQRELELRRLEQQLDMGDIEIDQALNPAVDPDAARKRAQEERVENTQIAASLLEGPSGPIGNRWRHATNKSWVEAKKQLENMGISPNSRQGKLILGLVASRAGIKLGKKGNPAGRVYKSKAKK